MGWWQLGEVETALPDAIGELSPTIPFTKDNPDGSQRLEKLEP
jgi:hypothetical protein